MSGDKLGSERNVANNIRIRMQKKKEMKICKFEE